MCGALLGSVLSQVSWEMLVPCTTVGALSVIESGAGRVATGSGSIMGSIIGSVGSAAGSVASPRTRGNWTPTQD